MSIKKFLRNKKTNCQGQNIIMLLEKKSLKNKLNQQCSSSKLLSMTPKLHQ